MASYVNPGSCIAVSVVFIVLGVIAVAARYYVRLGMKRGALGPDDWLCIPALFFTIACSIDVIIGVKRHAVGYHTNFSTSTAVENAQSKAMVALLQMFYLFRIFQTLGLGFVKLSILFFYRRVFIGKVFNYISWTTIAVVTGWTIAFFFANVFTCGIHPSNNWGTITVINRNCVATRTLAVGFAMSDAIVDVAIFLMPLFWLWQLQMRLRQKVFLFLIFMTGGFAVAASICRCVIFAEAVFRPYLSPGTIFGDDSKDLLGVISTGVFWAMIEQGVALVVCCFPSLRPLIFTKSVDSLFFRSKNSSGSARRSSSGSDSTTTNNNNNSNHHGGGGSSSNNDAGAGSEVNAKRDLNHLAYTQSVSTERTAISDTEKEDRKYGYVFSDRDDRGL